MAFGRKKKPQPGDPISERARALNEQISQLESEIKKLDTQLHQTSSGPKFRSTALPPGMTAPRAAEKPAPPPPPKTHEPIFEEINKEAIKARVEADTADHFNDLGVRKYDLPALWHRLRSHLRGPTTTNPRLVNYLAAGGVQGLKPLRYEKRVARNRFIVLTIVVLIILLGTLMVVLSSLNRHENAANQIANHHTRRNFPRALFRKGAG